MHDAHIGSDFEQEFPDWQGFRQFVASRARFPAFDEQRALHQILMADLLSRLDQGRGEWLLKDSVGLPLRPPQGSPWPSDFRVEGTEDIHPAYVMPRTAFDIDLYARMIADATADEPEPGQAYAQQVQQALHAVVPRDRLADRQGLGLGGLIHYSMASPLRVWDNGQVMGTITAQPIDRRHGTRSLRPVDDPISLEIDVKPPAKVQLAGAPEAGHRGLVAFDVPGFHPVHPLLNPLANQTADKACTLTGPPVGLRGQSGTWHRYKDLFDLYFVARTCELDGDQLRHAIEHNWNWQRIQGGMPEPYRVFGHKPGPPEEPAVPWHDGCEQLRRSYAQLREYPGYSGMVELVGDLVGGVGQARNQTWVPGQGWRQQRAHQAARAAGNALLRPSTTSSVAPSPPQEPKRSTPSNPTIDQQQRHNPHQSR